MGGHTVLRVLLISPVADLDPASGDVTYTEQLLASPPPGVCYTTYDQALARGDLVEVGTRASLRVGTWSKRLQSGAVAAWRKGETLVRRSGWAYRERLRHFRVASGAFDLVHVHVFHTRFLGEHPPVVMSSGSPLSWLYQDAFGWDKPKVASGDWIDRVVGRLWRATMCGGPPGQAVRHIAASEHYRSWLIDRGHWPDRAVDVVPNYLTAVGPDEAPSRCPKRLLIVARDFEAKGGPDVLEAFARVHDDDPATSLTVVGPQRPTRIPEGVDWLGLIPRDRLIHEVLPRCDILVHPTRIDVLPYSPMEALAQGLPIIVSAYRAIPEMAADGAGLVVPVGDVNALTEAMKKLLDPKAHSAASAAARRLFNRRFSASSQAPRLGDVYASALDGTRGPGEGPY